MGVILSFALMNFYSLTQYSSTRKVQINHCSISTYPHGIRNDGIKQITEDDITVLIKTMDRLHCLDVLVNSIKGYHPNIRIIIADDGMVKSPLFNISDVYQFYMPLDSGLSAGRNLLLSQATTPYVLLLDDDFSWDASIIPKFLKVFNYHQDMDIIAGRAGLDFAGLLIGNGEDLFLVKDNYGFTNRSGINCQLVDFVPNFFIAKTASLLMILWDNHYRNGEHESHFLRVKESGLGVMYCSDINVENLQIKCGESTEVEELRMKKRARSLSYIQHGISLHGFDTISYCLGAEFKNPLWEIKKGPNNEDCYKLPLPSHCPMGFEGLMCDRCKTGFKGYRCDTCQKNYYGPECTYCSCNSGKCIVEPQVKCLCSRDYYGVNCDRNMILKKTQMILDPGFKELERMELIHWFPWRDGCQTYTSEGLVFNSYDKQKCGIGQFIAINQRFPSELVLFLSAKILKIENESSIASDELCLHIDTTFTDSSNHWGSMVGFGQIVTKDWQTEHVILDFEKSIKSIRVYFILREIKAIVLIKNFEIKMVE